MAVHCRDGRESVYIILWEFRVKEGRSEEFERAYGPDGDWVRLFREAEGYLGTDLGEEVDGSGRYVTIDRWTSREAHDRFRRERQGAYRALDERLEGLTREEIPLGSFQVPDGRPR